MIKSFSSSPALVTFSVATTALVCFFSSMKTAFAQEAERQDAESTAAVDVINALGIHLFKSWPSREPNVCISPYSITAALAMTYPGSSGETRDQMSAALGFPVDAAGLAASFQSLDRELDLPAGDPDVALARANRLFGQSGYPFREEFLKLVAGNFSAPLEQVNFEKAHEEARLKINAWVEEQTADRIPDLLPGGSLDAETRLVLVNALYFKAPWRNEFSAGATAPMSFQTAAGEEKTVPMMRQVERMGYLKVPGATIVALPYRGLPFHFLAILPDDGMKDPQSVLSPELFGQCKEIPHQMVNLKLPKFRIEPPTVNLADTLAAMGMPSAFDRPPGSANFDAMAPRTPNEYLYVSGVYHKTFIEVDEKGTEAAAATAVAMMRATSIQVDEPVEVRLDRPFFYAIQHQSTGAVFFLGRLSNP